MIQQYAVRRTHFFLFNMFRHESNLSVFENGDNKLALCLMHYKQEKKNEGVNFDVLPCSPVAGFYCRRVVHQLMHMVH
jgi:hypothetical protein